MDIQIVAVLIGVVLGWLLSQCTEVVKERSNQNKKIQSIYIELSDLEAWIARMLYGVKHSLQLSILDNPVKEVPAKLHAFILKEYFHEICMYLERDVRIGFTDIYESVITINELIDQLKYVIDNPEENQKKKLIEKLEAIYSNAYDMRFKANFLLTHKDGDISKLRGIAGELEKKLEKELNEIVSEANELGADKLKEKYFTE